MRKQLGAGVLLACAALALTGCGDGGGDAGFSKAWQSQYPGANMTTATQHAKDVCAAFKAGTTYQDEIAYIKSASSATDGDARAMIATATANYCTQYKDLH
jgi:hypothetical protein